MIRSGFKPKLPSRPVRDRSAEFASHTPHSAASARMTTTLDCAAHAPGVPKTPGRVSTAIRESARGEECSVRIVGACNFDPATSVWSHLPSIAGGRGMGMKAIDECGAVACSACHDVVDGRRPLPPGASATSVMLDWCFGHFRSLVLLKQKGLL